MSLILLAALAAAPTSTYSPLNLEACEIVTVDPAPRTLWSSPALRRPDNDMFEIVVPRAFLAPGNYQVVIWGVSGARQERVSNNPLRVAETAR